MNHDQLLAVIRTGVMMREAQSAYFKNRIDGNLRRAKSLETAFDKQAQEALTPTPVQTTLFEEES